MFGFIKRKKKKDTPLTEIPETQASATATEITENPAQPELSQSLEKTRRGFADTMTDFLLGKKTSTRQCSTISRNACYAPM